MAKNQRYDNPDYVKFNNDKRKKKETLNTLEQKLAWLDKSIEQDIRWLQRSEERLHEDRMKRHELWLKVLELRKDK